jgi:hypothetical protein
MNNDGRSVSIADRDKTLIDLQHQALQKKKQLQTNYEELLVNVQENPYLQDAIDNYKVYFRGEAQRLNRQIAELKKLLPFTQKKEDKSEIKREIKALEKSLYIV